MSSDTSLEKTKRSLELFTESITGSGTGMTDQELEEVIKRKNEEKVHIKIVDDVQYDIGVLHPSHKNTF